METYRKLVLSNIDERKDIHLVLITSVINPKNANSIYSENERFDQLLNTIDSINIKIPNSYVVILEGSNYSEIMETSVLNRGANICYINVDNYDKQYGECNLLKSFLSSSFFNKLKSYNILTINKISGRYYLTDNFTFNYDNETCICSLITPDKSWSSYGIINTRFYSIPYKYLNNLITGINKCCQNLLIDIEHSFYLYNVIPIDKINKNIIKLNLSGYFAPTGEFIDE